LSRKIFTTAIVRPPAGSFAKGLTTSGLGPPDLPRALDQHAAYCETLEHCGLKVVRLEPDERYPDSTFVEDTAVITTAKNDDGAFPILTRPGAPSRSGEVLSISETLSQFFPDLLSIEPPGTVDGGDVCEAEGHFFIGVSERTNESGARQLSKIVGSLGYSSSLIDIRALKTLLHLKSGLAYAGDNRLVLIDELADEEAFQSYEQIRVDSDEQYAANCVPINDYVLVAAGFPKFEDSIRALGYQPLTLEMSEFEKMDGGLSCLSLRF
jgi:dimethylargininase